LGVDFVRRLIDSTEVTIAEESSLAGALAEFTPIYQIDKCQIFRESPILDRAGGILERHSRSRATGSHRSISSLWPTGRITFLN
jgi:hypothetical protein